MTHGVIGNTSDFGSEESRFETWWVNKKSGSGSERGGPQLIPLFLFSLSHPH